LLVLGVDEFLRRWENKQPTDIKTKPLPDPDTLNTAIPEIEWEEDLNGNPAKPWQHYVGVYLVDPNCGRLFRYEHCTWGAHEAYNVLKEAVIVMRSLRGSRVIPLVNLGERFRKSKKFGMQRHPHFEIIPTGWKIPGGDTETVPKQPTPQLPSPVAKTPPTDDTIEPRARRPKPTVKLTDDTLNAMGDVKPATTGEILNDELPW
jgi:hypothetical protein